MSEEKHNMLEEVKSKAKKEAEEILRLAQRVADKEINIAKSKAKQILKEKEKIYREKTDKEKRKKLTQLNIEFRQKKLSYQYELVERLFKEALDEMQKLECNENYLNLLKKLILDALYMIDKKEVTIYLNKKDTEFVQKQGNFDKLKKFLEDNYNHSLKINISKTPIQTSGGVVVSSVDGRIKYYNTFEDILERKREYLESDILKELF